MESSCSGSAEEVDVGRLPPFMILEYPKEDFEGRRDKCSFILIPPNEQQMERIILESGGQVLTGSEGDEAEFAVTIMCEGFYLKYPQKDCTLPLDTFSSVYIHEAIESSKKNLPLPNLNDFRITRSKYQDYKPEDILWKKKKWSELTPLAKPTRKRITAQQLVEQLKIFWKGSPVKSAEPQESSSNDAKECTPAKVAPAPSTSTKECTPADVVPAFSTTPTVEHGHCSAEDVSFEEEKENEVAAVMPKRPKRVAGRKFTREEGQKLLDLICEKDAFMFTKGDKIFQLMELSKHFPGRTWQSLKEHWKRTVHPNVVKYKIYNVSPADLDKLLKACERSKWTKHQNYCPDYEF